VTLAELSYEILMKPVILSDIDGVLAYYAQGALTAVNSRFGTRYAYENLTSYDYKYIFDEEEYAWYKTWRASPEALALLAPNYHAIDFVNACHEAGHYVVIASGRPKTAATITRQWLDAHHVQFDLTVLEGDGSKQSVAREHSHNVLWLDDDPRMFGVASEVGAILYHPRMPWTPKKVPKNVRVIEPGVKYSLK
jgi:uncharacterized HAD superfamily protein